MPPVKAMGIELRGFSGDRLQLSAPLAANVNDKGNAFGGSLASAMTLAGWALGDEKFTAELQKHTARRVSKSRAGRPPKPAISN